MVWAEDSRSMQCLRAGRKQEQTEEERGLETEGRESRMLSTGNEDVRKEGDRRVGMASLEWSLRFVPSRGPDCHLCTFTSSSEAGSPRRTR